MYKRIDDDNNNNKNNNKACEKVTLYTANMCIARRRCRARYIIFILLFAICGVLNLTLFYFYLVVYYPKENKM